MYPKNPEVRFIMAKMTKYTLLWVYTSSLL